MEQIAEKRFPATAKRRHEARKKGQVLKSQELTSAVMLLALVAFLKFWIPNLLDSMANILRYAATLSIEWNIRTVWEVMINVSWECLLILGPLFMVAMAVAVAVNYLQVGSLFTVEPIMPKLSRLNPLEGIKRMFGIKSLVQLVKSLFKVIIIGYFLFDSIRDNMDIFPVLQAIEVSQSITLIGNLLYDMAWNISLAFLILAILDSLYQWWDYEKSMRMSHEEIKEEYKQAEGDPQLKGQIRKRQRMIAMRRMMEDLKQADVVITNPTHFAVALKYDLSKHPAPFVVAKGQDEIALRIRAIAEESNIVIMENKPLARALYAQVDLGEVVPADLYKAVAEVLAFVYKLNKRKRSYTA